MDRVETRELAYFVAVAEELHFGRAAQRLGIAQPPLSRAIQQLERRLGVTLLERSSRRVALTPAGEVLLRDGRIALDAMSAATRRAQRTGWAEPRMAVVMKPGGDGGLLPDILDAYRSEPDAVGVEVLLCGRHEREVMVRDGRADVGFLHSTHGDLSGFETQALLEEGQVAALSARHRLAGRRSLLMADLEGEPMPRWPGAPGGAEVSPRIRTRGS
jgi:DNA-binding transcriptional LysR family regulator